MGRGCAICKLFSGAVVRSATQGHTETAISGLRRKGGRKSAGETAPWGGGAWGSAATQPSAPPLPLPLSGPGPRPAGPPSRPTPLPPSPPGSVASRPPPALRELLDQVREAQDGAAGLCFLCSGPQSSEGKAALEGPGPGSPPASALLVPVPRTEPGARGASTAGPLGRRGAGRLGRGEAPEDWEPG